MNEIYLNTASTGIVDQSYIDKAYAAYSGLSGNASGLLQNWNEVEAPKLKVLMSNTFGATLDEIAFVPNFSFGINAVYSALSENMNILTYKKDYPSLLDPLQFKNFNIFTFDDVDGFEFYPETIERYIDKHYIDALVISHVQWQTGFKIDLKAISKICKDRNVRMIVDATQSAGAIDINFDDTDVDVMVFSNYKWMNSGFGSGTLLMKPDFLEEFPPKISGMHSYTYENDIPKLIPSMKFYEPGHQNIFGLEIQKLVLGDRNKEEIQKIEKGNYDLTNYFLGVYSSSKIKIVGGLGMKNRSSIVYLEGDEAFQKYLSANNVISSFRNGQTRVSFHQHNTKEEIDYLAALIAKY